MYSVKFESNHLHLFGALWKWKSQNLKIIFSIWYLLLSQHLVDKQNTSLPSLWFSFRLESRAMFWCWWWSWRRPTCKPPPTCTSSTWRLLTSSCVLVRNTYGHINQHTFEDTDRLFKTQTACMFNIMSIHGFLLYPGRLLLYPLDPVYTV